MYFFYLIEQHSKFLLHTLHVLYMCTLCDSANINTIIEFIPHVSGDGFSGGSDSYLQFRDTCGKRRNINVIFDLTPQKEITWGCIWSVMCMNPTIILNNPVYIVLLNCNLLQTYRLCKENKQTGYFS